jgi:hypothetical protein
MTNRQTLGHRAYICVACGTQHAPSLEPPPLCSICADARQFVGLDGQQWTTLEQLRSTHGNNFVVEEPGIHSISTQPAFGIGERAFLIQTPAGNVLWDCIALIDQSTINALHSIGGVAAIAISHPHYYTTMIDWSIAPG